VTTSDNVAEPKVKDTYHTLDAIYVALWLEGIPQHGPVDIFSEKEGYIWTDDTRIINMRDVAVAAQEIPGVIIWLERGDTRLCGVRFNHDNIFELIEA
jgi:hypothetical protein